jgi:hypothetical protein
LNRYLSQSKVVALVELVDVVLEIGDGDDLIDTGQGVRRDDDGGRRRVLLK